MSPSPRNWRTASARTRAPPRRQIEVNLLESETKPIEANEILRILPHRYPFLLVDRILEIEPGQRAVAVKNVSVNEPFFSGHFPGEPIMPGVLIIEMMAQTAGVMMLILEENKGKLAYLAG